MTNDLKWFMGGQVGLCVEGDWEISKKDKKIFFTHQYVFTSASPEATEPVTEELPVTKGLLEYVALFEALDVLHDSGKLEHSPYHLVQELFHTSEENGKHILEDALESVEEFELLKNNILDKLVIEFDSVIVN
jgi:hypothetical protein